MVYFVVGLMVTNAAFFKASNACNFMPENPWSVQPRHDVSVAFTYPPAKCGNAR